MSEQEAVRRLVKSGPELWAQCSDPSLLSRHLAAFGEITITRSEPESTVAWEGESARGTVSLEPSGWGTRVRLTAHRAPAPEVPDAPDAPDSAAPAAVAAVTPDPPPALSLAARPSRLSAVIGALMHRRRSPVAIESASAPAVAVTDVSAERRESPPLIAELEAALDSLGAAHHRPYSRS